MRKRLARVGRDAGGYSFRAVHGALVNNALRLTQIGDAARCDPMAVRAAVTVARRLGTGILSYTHFWKEVAERGDQDMFTASTGSLEEADDALALGFARATTVLPWDAYKGTRHFTTPGGARGIVCPSLWNMHRDAGRKLSCQECMLCDPARKGPQVIGFPDHGNVARGKARKLAKQPNAPAWASSVASWKKKLANGAPKASTLGPSVASVKQKLQNLLKGEA